MAKKAYVVLKLKDQFSKPLKIAEKGTKEFAKQQKLALDGIKHFGKTLNNKFKSAVKSSAVALAGLSAVAAKAGLSEAMNLEGYRTQLETATKDTKKAAEIMKYSIGLANKTPFEGGELVEAAAKFEAMGMSAKKWLTYAGDMAGATNKSFDQATEALIDAQAGELERLKEFGITKRQIAEKANKLFGKNQVINNKGQIVDQKKFNKAMLSIMKDKFAGGMEKQSKTLKGTWSTVTGITKTALANIIGMSSDGSTRAGSALEVLKEKVGSLASKLEEWQNDGTLDTIAQKVGTFLRDAIDKVSEAVAFLRDNFKTIKPVLLSVITAFTAFNIINSIAKTIQSFTIVINVLKIAFAGLNLATLGWTLVIAAVIVAIILLIKNWKKVLSWLKKIKELFMSCGGPIGAFRDKILAIAGAFKTVIGWISKAITALKKFLKIDANKKISIDKKTPRGNAPRRPKGPRHATGSSYFAGGFTRFSESGRSEAAIFPSGTKIIPHDQVPKMNSSKVINVYYNVQGNLIGNREYMEQTGEYIAAKIIEAGDNI